MGIQWRKVQGTVRNELLQPVGSVQGFGSDGHRERLNVEARCLMLLLVPILAIV